MGEVAGDAQRVQTRSEAAQPYHCAPSAPQVWQLHRSGSVNRPAWWL